MNKISEETIHAIIALAAFWKEGASTIAEFKKDLVSVLEATIEEPSDEPVAWRDPTNPNPEQGCTYTKLAHEKWPHVFRQALYAHPTSKAIELAPLLTNEEIDKLWETSKVGFDLSEWKVIRAFARSVENRRFMYTTK